MKRTIIIILAYAAILRGQSLSINSGPGVISPGEEVIVTVTVQDIDDLKAYSIFISYDPSALRCVGIEKQNFLSNGYSTFFFSKIDSMQNILRIEEAILGPGSVSGSGILTRIRFRGIAISNCYLSFISTDLRNSNNNALTVDTSGCNITVTTVSNCSDHGAVYDFNLKQNYPNPFNTHTTIEFSLNESSLIILEVYNPLGERVGTLTNSFKLPGTYRLDWNAADLPSGTYIYKLSKHNGSISKKMILLK